MEGRTLHLQKDQDSLDCSGRARNPQNLCAHVRLLVPIPLRRQEPWMWPPQGLLCSKQLPCEVVVMVLWSVMPVRGLVRYNLKTHGPLPPDVWKTRKLMDRFSLDYCLCFSPGVMPVFQLLPGVLCAQHIIENYKVREPTSLFPIVKGHCPMGEKNQGKL